LREWLITNQIYGETGMDNPAVDGFFIDDYWCFGRGSCGDPTQGPTEVERHSQFDMGLSDAAVKALTDGWKETMGEVQRAILKKGGYTWSLMSGQSNANAAPTILDRKTCAATLRAACMGGADETVWQNQAHLVGLKVNGTKLPQLKQDVAFFLLARGPYAWLGWGEWGMTWPFNPEPAHGELPPLPEGVPRPALLDHDFGEPVGLCKEAETGPLNGTFVRRWTKAGLVTLDCNSFEAAWGA